MCTRGAGRGIDQVLRHPCDSALHEDYVHSAMDYVRLAETANGPIPLPAGPSYLWGAALDELNRMRPDVRIINLETSIVMSDSMKALPGLSWLRKGTPVRRGTLTARFNADDARVPRGERASDEIDVIEWLGGSKSTIVMEEVIGLGRYGRTLTVLSSTA